MAAYRKAIVRAPAENFSQGLTSAHLGVPEYSRVLEQHESYCIALERCGLELIRLEADKRYPDSTFVEDTAVVTEKGAIITRPGAPSRLGEVDIIRKTLAQSYSQVNTIVQPATLDGGDVCQADDHFFIGLSHRTNEAGAEQLAQLLSSFAYTSSLIEIRDYSGLLHLKSGLAYLGQNRLIIDERLAVKKEFKDYDLVVVDEGEDHGANCLLVNGHLLLADGFPKLERRLKQCDFHVTTLYTSEFQKMDGGLSCLSLRF